jgi:acyl-CoA thioesterase-1
MRHAFVSSILTALMTSVLLAGCGGDGGGSVSGDSRASRSPADESTDDAATSQDEPRRGSEGSVGERRDDVLRMVFLGTSLTAGLGLPDPELQSWAHLLGVRAREAGYAVQLVNAGVSGDTSAGGLRRLEWLLEDRVDVLVVELGANDGLRGLSLQELDSNLREIITMTRSHWPDAGIVLAGMEAPPNMGSEYVEEFRSTFADVARDEGVARIPFLLEGVAAVPSLNQADGIHPTSEGHERMAETAWPTVEEALEELLVSRSGRGATPGTPAPEEGVTPGSVASAGGVR